MRKNEFKKNLPTLPPREFLHIYAIMSDNTVFLVKFGIYLHL